MTAAEHVRWLDADAVSRERDAEAWEALEVFEDGGDVWRRAGFSLAEAARWMDTIRDILLYDEDVEDDDEETKSALAAGFIVAGLRPSDAESWASVVPWRDCRDIPGHVVDWQAAGFTPKLARPWAARESVASAALLANGGWSPLERDLLDAWLEVHGTQVRRTAWLETSASPGHVLDYVRAGVHPREAGYYERARRDGRDVTADLRQRASRVEVKHDRLAQVAALTDSLGVRRAGLHTEPIPGLEYLMGGLTHSVELAMPVDFNYPEWAGESLGSEVDTYKRGYGEWEGYWPPEDSACPPELNWTAEHHDLFLKAYTESWGDALDEGESFTMSWPPQGSLWREGHAREADLGICDRHDEVYDTCAECQIYEGSEEEIEPAEWHWYVRVITNELRGDQIVEVRSQDEHIMTTLMDPRVVEYTESGVSPGNYYP